MSPTPPPPAQPLDAADPAETLAALRAEIDRLDDRLHDLVMLRAGIVARLAASQAKGSTIPLRPGREALILRRLLARHAGPLPQAALVRLWREILTAGSRLQGAFSVALFARQPEHERLAREHFGALTPLRSHPSAAAALAAVGSGDAAVAVLPLPEEGESPEAAWWLRLNAPRLQVVARLPFWTAAAEPGPEALAIAPVPPDATGHDRSLLRIETVRAFDAPEISRTALLAALREAGLQPLSLLVQRHPGGLSGLAEAPGLIAADDPRLGALQVARAQPLGGYAIPIRGE